MTKILQDIQISKQGVFMETYVRVTAHTKMQEHSFFYVDGDLNLVPDYVLESGRYVQVEENQSVSIDVPKYQALKDAVYGVLYKRSVKKLTDGTYEVKDKEKMGQVQLFLPQALKEDRCGFAPAYKIVMQEIEMPSNFYSKLGKAYKFYNARLNV